MEFATNEMRVQLATDVLTQLAAGSICAVARGNWFIGFPVGLVIETDLPLNEEDLTFDNCYVSFYESFDEVNPKDGHPYLIIGSRNEGLPSSTPDSLRSVDLQELLQKIPICEVCAIGALTVAAARRYDNMTVGALGTPGIFKSMSGYFDFSQLLLIEAVYERFASGILAKDLAAEAENLWPNVVSGIERLRCIMHNIIENNGQFLLPSQKSA